MATKKNVKYSEPTDYLPKEIRDQFFKNKSTGTGTKKKSGTTSNKKKK